MNENKISIDKMKLKFTNKTFLKLICSTAKILAFVNTKAKIDKTIENSQLDTLMFFIFVLKFKRFFNNYRINGR